ncbi:hypothetical protein [Tenacibaculum sp. nBUS_03]|uniref:hypothetical protein n=1 Tax=Tenacibaculum sp. nBUS_03 TaxID=3395320 RepID=UPI003EC0C57A
MKKKYFFVPLFFNLYMLCAQNVKVLGVNFNENLLANSEVKINRVNDIQNVENFSFHDTTYEENKKLNKYTYIKLFRFINGSWDSNNKLKFLDYCKEIKNSANAEFVMCSANFKCCSKNNTSLGLSESIHLKGGVEFHNNKLEHTFLSMSFRFW